MSCWIYHFHMPLFFFLSGVFFSPTIQGLVKRARQTLIPYLIFGVLSFIYWRFAEMRFRPLPENFDANMHLLDLLWQKNQFRFNVPLWFLPCLVIVQSIGAIIFRSIKSQKVLLVIVILWVLIANCIDLPIKVMWIKESFYAFPLFALGYVIGKERYMKIEVDLSKRKYRLLCLSAILILCFVWLFSNSRNDMMTSLFPNGYLTFTVVALICILSLFVLTIHIHSNKILVAFTWLGVNSLSLMCLHEPLKRIIVVIFSKLLGMETDVLRESILFSTTMSCLIITLLVPTCLFVNKKCKWILGKS